MNARIPTANHMGVINPVLPWDDELERNVLGLVLLGYPAPDWLEPRHFFAGQHRAIFRAARELGSKASLPTVYAYLRDVAAAPLQQPRYERDVTGLRSSTAPAASSVELVGMLDGADHALRMGWPIDHEQLRELWRQRELIAAMRRVEVRLLHGDATHVEARAELSEHFRGCK